MSGGAACRCKPRNAEVTGYRCNYSAFNGYQFTPSDYSAVRCLTCGAVWRTKAKWVDKAPLAAPDKRELQQATTSLRMVYAPLSRELPPEVDGRKNLWNRQEPK